MLPHRSAAGDLRQQTGRLLEMGVFRNQVHQRGGLENRGDERPASEVAATVAY